MAVVGRQEPVTRVLDTASCRKYPSAAGDIQIHWTSSARSGSDTTRPFGGRKTPCRRFSSLSCAPFFWSSQCCFWGTSGTTPRTTVYQLPTTVIAARRKVARPEGCPLFFLTMGTRIP